MSKTAARNPFRVPKPPDTLLPSSPPSAALPRIVLGGAVSIAEWILSTIGRSADVPTAPLAVGQWFHSRANELGMRKVDISLRDKLERLILEAFPTNFHSQSGDRFRDQSLGVEKVCWEFLSLKYRDEERATAHWRWLTTAVGILAFHLGAYGADATLEEIQRIVRRRARSIGTTKRDIATLRALGRRLLSPATLERVEAELAAKPTTLGEEIAVLREFLGHPKIRGYFDKTGRLRRRKRQNVHETRLALVELFQDPQTLARRGFPDWPQPLGLPLGLSPGEAYTLTASCMKALFPKDISREYDADSVRHAFQYARVNRRRRRP